MKEMGEPLTDRFEFIEERLERLEKVGLSLSEAPKIGSRPEAYTAASERSTSSWDRSSNSGTDESEARSGRDRAASILTTPETGNAAFHVGTMPRQTTEDGCDSLLSRLARIAQRDNRQAAAIQECHEKLMKLVEEAVSSADRRLTHLVEQVIVRFTEDSEKALQKSAGVIASRVIQLLQQEIQIATQRSLRAGLPGVKTSLAGSAIVTNIPQCEGKIVPGRSLVGDFEQAEYEFSPVNDQVRRDSAALLAALDIRLRATLHAFEEDAAKQLAASFQKTVGELLEHEHGEVRRHEGSQERDAAPDASLSAPHAGTGQPSVHPIAECHTPASVTVSESKSGKNSDSIFGRLGFKRTQEVQNREKTRPIWHTLGLS